jgi:thermitase
MRPVVKFSSKRASTTALLALFVASFGCSGIWTASIADTSPKPESAYPLTVKKMPPPGEGGWREDTLIVLANPKSTQDDLQDALAEVKGTVERKIKVGNQEFLVIKTEKGKLEETYKTMVKDSTHFSLVQRNFTYKKIQVQCNIANDPAFASQYELNTLKVPGGWCKPATGQGQTIAILDTGVAQIAELSGKLATGFNAVTGLPPGNIDTDPDSLGHGTACATTAAAISNNSVNSASPAYDAQIYPIIISDSQGSADDESLIAALGECITKNVKLASCSFNAVPPYSFSNAAYHPALHVALNQYNAFGGIFFNAAGNEKKTIKDPRRNNLIVVEAIDSALKLAKFSNKGSSVWFAAPGVLVQCSNKSGLPVRISGTSFSTPLTAGVAAMVWSAHPEYTAAQLLSRLATTSNKTFKKYSLNNFGYGIPNAQAASQ